MTRILTYLAAVNLFTLLTTFSVGLLSWLRGAVVVADLNYPLHLYLGLFTVIFNLGLHCLVFIYFLGTGRWVKEVAIAYKLPDEPHPRLTRELKRWTFPVALAAMVVPIATAAAGMAQFMDGHPAQPWRVFLHLGLALSSLLVNVWALRVEIRNVTTNAGIIDQVMREVERIRAEQGLPTNAEAWNASE